MISAQTDSRTRFYSLTLALVDGKTWTQTNATAPSSYSRYTHALAIHPSNTSTIYYGGLQLFVSIDSGQTFTGLGNNGHPDHHALLFPAL